MSTVQTENITGLAGGLPQNLKPVTATAWVNFEGSTFEIFNSFNTSSVVDVGIGQYIVSYSNSQDVTEYPAVATCENISASLTVGLYELFTSSAKITVRETISGGFADVSPITFMAFGGTQ